MKKIRIVFIAVFSLFICAGCEMAAMPEAAGYEEDEKSRRFPMYPVQEGNI